LSDSIQALVSAASNESTSWRYISKRQDVRSALPVSRKLRSGVLQRALAYMEANLSERFSLETLAEAAGMSRFHFARVFRIATGCSPMEFLMRQRVARGKEILLQGEISICDVAAFLGFCDQSHFTRTFRRVAGMSPREYLRNALILKDTAPTPKSRAAASITMQFTRAALPRRARDQRTESSLDN
jgi:AraC family transcriptional regulator